MFDNNSCIASTPPPPQTPHLVIRPQHTHPSYLSQHKNPITFIHITITTACRTPPLTSHIIPIIHAWRTQAHILICARIHAHLHTKKQYIQHTHHTQQTLHTQHPQHTCFTPLFTPHPAYPSNTQNVLHLHYMLITLPNATTYFILHQSSDIVWTLHQPKSLSWGWGRASQS